MGGRVALAALGVALATLAPASARTYEVGPGQPYATVQDLIAHVAPGDGDVILVHPGTYPPFRVTKGGGACPETAPVIRAYDMADKPVFDADGERYACLFYHGSGKWYALEGVEVRGAPDTGILNVQCGLVVRYSYIHDCGNGLGGGSSNTRDSTPGYLIAEHNEFARNGMGIYLHQIYNHQYWTIFRYNYIHDNSGGACYKDRSRDSLVAYNYIEQGPGATYAIEFCGCADDAAPDYTQTAVMIGNVVTKKQGANRWLFIANIRKEGGAEGRLNIGRLYLVNNTFYSEEHIGPMLGDDEGSIIYADNNIFHSATCDRIVDQVDMAEGPGECRPSYNNWVRTGMEAPKEFVNTVSGDDPGLVEAAWRGGDFHLRPGSACVDAGTDRGAPLPWLEYVHPHSYTYRLPDKTLDIGAFEHRPRRRE